MTPGWQLLFFAVAFGAFVVAAVLSALQRGWSAALVALGLAAWVFVYLWDAGVLYD